MTTATAIDTKIKQKLQEVKLWKVVFLNDNYTPFDFVIEVLTTLYAKDVDTASQIALSVHEQGRGTAGIYPKEIAMQKAYDTVRIAQAHEHPLKAIAEEA